MFGFQFNDGTESIECRLPAMSIARCAEISDFKVAIEYLETVRDEALACVMLDFIKEIWKAKVFHCIKIEG
jgi:hypothetical protein